MEDNDAQQIQKIVMGYARQATKTEEEANQFILGLAEAVKEDGAKLVHFGNTVFLLLVRGQGVVEIHTMALNEDSVTLAKHFNMLANYLKNIGATVAYTYADDPKFVLVAKRTKLPFKTQEVTMPDGQKTTAFYVEF